MQLLCLVAMEPPARMDADSVRNEKVAVLRTLNPMTKVEVAKFVMRGQYGAGSILGERVPGYREEPDVRPDSTTETYVAMRLNLDSWRWAGVPFFLRTGKRLPKRVSEIAIQFRMPPVRLFQQDGRAPGDAEKIGNAPNLLLLRIQPDEGISLTFDAKAPGMRMRLRPVKMDFRYGTSFGEPSPEAYERLLLDAIIGDPTLFTRNDEVEASWEFVNSIQKAWEQLPPPAFPNYAAGSWGPQEADRLFESNEGSWRKP
jgi:glucose-6-phosphate 1-dehydrogenase